MLRVSALIFLGFLCSTPLAVLAEDSQEPDVPVGLPKSTPWGAPEDGLQARFAVSQTEMPVGSRVDVQLYLRFDPKGVDEKLNLLNRGKSAWEMELVFKDTRSNNVFRRRPFDIGMPRGFGPDIVELRGAPLMPHRLTIYLLNDAGEQIPPGVYTVTAVYQSTAEAEVEFWRDEHGTRGTRPYSGPLKFWKGTITSAPITLTVLPAEPEEIELKISSALVISLGKDGDRNTIGWTWSQDAPITAKAKRRPGYVIGRRYVLHALLDGRDIGRVASGLGGAPNGAANVYSGTGFLQPETVERALAGTSLKLRADVEVFETSVPSRHAWMPEAGDLKILWQGSVAGTLSRELAPENDVR